MTLMKNTRTRQRSIQVKKLTLRMVFHLEAKTKIALDWLILINLQTKDQLLNRIRKSKTVDNTWKIFLWMFRISSSKQNEVKLQT